MDDTRLTLPKTERKKKAPRVLLIVLVLLLALGAGAAFRHFLQKRGRIEPAQKLIPLLVPREGAVLALLVKAGDEVEQGRELLRLDDAHIRSSLLEERRRLESLAAPEAPPDEQDGEALALREEQLRLLEEEAQRRVQETSEREAGAAVEYSRALARQNREKNQAEKRASLEKKLLEARRDLAEARREFAAQSRRRAELSAEIRNRNKQRQSGSGRTPADVRRDAYARQKEKVLALENSLENSVIRAPAKGVVADILVKAGDRVQGGDVCLVLLPAPASP
ncbi:MAG: hypothetical protein LBB52_00045 [Desulfovibrio sp.]|jgi:multidrug resistance efflux pump|nr:hypothetical protein [Desulfovibrio sp.]